MHAVPLMATASLAVHTDTGFALESHVRSLQQYDPAGHSFAFDDKSHLHDAPTIGNTSLVVHSHVVGVALHVEANVS